MLNKDLLRTLADQQKQSGAYSKILKALTTNDLLDAAIRICQINPADFEELQRLLAKTLGDSYLEILSPIFVRYPDIKPSNYP